MREPSGPGQFLTLLCAHLLLLVITAAHLTTAMHASDLDWLCIQCMPHGTIEPLPMWGLLVH